MLLIIFDMFNALVINLLRDAKKGDCTLHKRVNNYAVSGLGFL